MDSELVEWFLGKHGGPFGYDPECCYLEEIEGEEYYKPGIILTTNYHIINKALFEYPWLSKIDDINGNTALHIVAQYDNEEVAQLLLNYGANISKENIYGSRPLDVAHYYMSSRTMIVIYNHAVKLIQMRWREILTRRWLRKEEMRKNYFLQQQFQGMAI